MKVTLRMHQASDPFFFEEVLNAYTKGPLYCMRMKEGYTLKFPLISIFSIREEKAYTSQEKPK